MKKNYYLSLMPYIPKIFDFDRSVIENVKNPMVEARIPHNYYQAEDRDDPNRFLRSIYDSSKPNVKKWIDNMYNGKLNNPDGGTITGSGFVLGKASNWPNAFTLLTESFFDEFKII